MADGRFPRGILLGPATRAWHVEQIRQLLKDFENQKVTPRRQGARKPKVAQ
jgi:predicted DNA-binding transcriptional regulator AlpA